MDINKMLAELRAERDQLAEAILVLERLAAGRDRRRAANTVSGVSYNARTRSHLRT